MSRTGSFFSSIIPLRDVNQVFIGEVYNGEVLEFHLQASL